MPVSSRGPHSAAPGRVLPQRAQFRAVIAPDPLPLQLEPRGKLFAAWFGQLCLQCFRADPAPRYNLVPVDPDRAVAAADVDRAQLLFGTTLIELSLVLETEQELQWAA